MPESSRSSRPLVLVTGSSGLIGFATLCDLARDHQLVGLDLQCRSGVPREAETICFDITDDASVRSALDRVAYAYGTRVASVVHLAAFYRFSDDPHPLYEKVTVQGTRRLFETLLEKGFSLEQLLYASTMLVHAPAPPGKRIDERSPLAGKWPYPQSKIETEELLRDIHGDVPLVLLRMAGVYTDRGQAPAIAHQIARVHQRSLKSHLYSGDPGRGQSYVHLEDLVDAVRRIVERRHDLGPVEPFLIGEPETYGYEQLQHALGELLHGKEGWKTLQVPKTVAKVGAWAEDKASALPGVEEPFIKPFMVEMADDHYELDVSRAERLLGWRPGRRLIDTLPQMVAALEESPAAWYRAHKMTPP